MKYTTKTVKESLKGKVSFNKIGKKRNGNYYIMYGFFYQHSSAKALSEKVKEVIPNVNIVKTQDVWKPFKGGSPVEKSSHYYVEFSIPE